MSNSFSSARFYRVVEPLIFYFNFISQILYSFFLLLQSIFSGYPTHFGQLECLKLIASPHFPEKRIGYLGMMLLLSEEADVLMLSTNSLKNDMNSKNKFIAGLSLCTIGNLATADMSRDLAPEVDKHLKGGTPYLRKKANLAMARCLTKCPDMVEDFVDRVVTLLKDKNHGVLITVVQLMTQVLLIDSRNAEEEGEDPFETDCRKAFLRLVPMLVKMLRNLLGSGYSPEYDVGGISDPFLQVQLLTLLRLLGTQNETASEEMNDVLAQVATNTESSKNAGNAILYECVQTIMGIESEDGLRVLAVNILGRFLLNRDNNIRYVALNTLSRCIVEQQQTGDGNVPTESANTASAALQKHRQTVVDCLKDPDISIRQRALELIYYMVNQGNVESLAAELLNYLVLCPREHRRDICTRIFRVVEKFSPDDRWRVDTLITMLTIAGREASRDVQSATVIYISRSPPDIHAYATHKLVKAIRDDDGSQRGLLVVGVWCIGEYGDLLLNPYSYTPSVRPNDATTSVPVSITFMALDAVSVVEAIKTIIDRHSCPEYVKERALTSFAKLSDRFADKGDVAALDMLTKLIKKHEVSHSLELQLRSCEYAALINASKGIKTVITKPAAEEEDLFGLADNGGDGGESVSASVINAAKEALSRMPVVDLKVLRKKQEEAFGSVPMPSGNYSAEASAPASGGGDLLDLNDMFGGGTPASAPAPAQNGSSGVGGGDAPKSDLDLLSDIFAATPSSAPVNAAPTGGGGFDIFSTPAPQSTPAPANPIDLFGGPSAMPMSTPTPQNSNPLDIFGAPPPAQSQPAAMMATPNVLDASSSSAGPQSVIVPAFTIEGLTVEFECTKPEIWNKQNSELIARCKNAAPDALFGFNMQCAVPKYVIMEMEPPSSTTVPVTGMNNSKIVTQKIKVTNTRMGEKKLVLKIKVSFTLQGKKIEHMATCSGFPDGQY
ncbi:MAG: AP-1 complex subunit gamma-1 [Bacillariaceae sp.]